MPKTLIDSYPQEKRQAAEDGSLILNIAEFFCDTVQGENFVGIPSTFLRLQHCTLDCTWCDTAEVWRHGNPYSTNEILKMLEDNGVVKRFKNGQHIILTGGSPMLQQIALIDLLKRFQEKYDFKPFVEVENECTRMPHPEFVKLVNRWNNSPKLENSQMKKKVRYHPEILQFLSSLSDSWFKFVITSEADWTEIKQDFLDTGLIRKEQMVLMPEGQIREELQNHYDTVLDIAIRENIRMTDRMHVTIWNKKTGV